MIVGTLDSETLSLKTNAVVWEVALLKFKCNEFYEVLDEEVQVLQWTIDIFDQVKRGRDVQDQALDMHRNKIGNREFGSIIVGPTLSVWDALNNLRSNASNLDELWINKSSFDHSVLYSLAEQYNVSDSGPLWPHRAELDLRVLYRKLPITGGIKPTMPHRAVDDCWVNLRVLRQFGAWKKQLNF